METTNTKLEGIENKNEKKTEEKEKKNKKRNRRRNNRRKDHQGNDPKWYMRFPQLAKDAASFSFYNPVGLKTGILPVDVTFTEGNLTYKVTDCVMPGILKLHTLPTFGYSNNASSAVNAASRALYTFVRHANSGKTNYESPDLMMYLLAVSSIYQWYANLVRLYSLLRMYSLTNRYVPLHIISALGYDQSLINSIPSLRYHINYLATRLNTLAIPKDMYIFEQSMEEQLQVYKDSNNDKAQLYVFENDIYYLWSPRTSSKGSELEVINAPTAQDNARVTFAQITQFSTTLLNRLLGDEDIGIMSGDVLKAFSSSGIRAIKGISEDFVLLPVYDQNKLEQIHNASIYSVSADTITKHWNIRQDISAEESYIISTPHVDLTYYEALLAKNGMNVWMDSQYDSPSQEQVLEMVRFKTAAVPTAEPSAFPALSVAPLTACGTSVVRKIDVFTIEDAALVNISIERNVVVLAGNGSDVETQELCNYATLVNKFDWAPIIPTITFRASGAETTLNTLPLGEMFNYSVITPNQLARIQDLMISSLTIVPNMNEVALNR